MGSLAPICTTVPPMNPEGSWSELAREAAIDVKGLAKVQEKMPRLRVDITLTDAQVTLAFGKSTLQIHLDESTSSKPGQRDGAGQITPPDLKRAYFTTAEKDAVALEFDQPVDWTDALAGQFYLDGEKDKVKSGAVEGNVLTLKLKAPAMARTISYLKEKSWSQDKLLTGANGIATLTFCDVPILRIIAR